MHVSCARGYNYVFLKRSDFVYTCDGPTKQAGLHTIFITGNSRVI